MGRYIFNKNFSKIECSEEKKIVEGWRTLRTISTAFLYDSSIVKLCNRRYLFTSDNNACQGVEMIKILPTLIQSLYQHLNDFK